MHTISLLRRSVSRIVAGAFLSALFALGIAPAMAQVPNVTVTKTPDGGTVAPGGLATFTITVTNNEDFAVEDIQLYDPLPGIGIIDWDYDSPTPNDVGCNIYGSNPALEVLICDFNTLPAGESRTVTVFGLTPNTACLVLDNTAYVRIDDVTPIPLDDDPGSIGTTCGIDGRMTGGGSIFSNGKGSTRITHGFEIRCDATDHRQNLEINWPGAKPGAKNQNNFHLTSMTSATCFDNPDIGPQPPQAGFDTFIGDGVGTCNGEPASIHFVFTDAGEPGTEDTAWYVISGACTLDEFGYITKGNQQAHDTN